MYNAVDVIPTKTSDGRFWHATIVCFIGEQPKDRGAVPDDYVIVHQCSHKHRDTDSVSYKRCRQHLMAELQEHARDTKGDDT